ncbi:MAG: response regulator [Leptolyngbya sp. SIO4C1]|nr:response regulator [Leptolyngbya sp. SIO4C1]
MDSLSWSLYLAHGRLNFATNTEAPFDRLDNHLQRLSSDISVLTSDVRDKVRLLFEQTEDLSADAPSISSDYRAICWLVEQDYLASEQAAALIEAIALEVIEPFLGVKEGHYELIEREDCLSQHPKFCELNLRLIVEDCQKRRRGRLSSVNTLGTAYTSASESAIAAGSTSSNPAAPSLDSSAGLPSLQTNQGAATANGSTPEISFSASAYRPRQTFQSTGQSSQPPAESAESQTARFTIACIDDSPTVLNAIRSFLNDKSLAIVTINDPVKALMQIMRSKPDLILLDITMPNLDGYELCSLLRRHPYFKNTPIVMVTGNTGLIDRAKAKLVRASGYLTKPFSQSDLLKMVFMHLPIENA